LDFLCGTFVDLVCQRFAKKNISSSAARVPLVGIRKHDVLSHVSALRFTAQLQMDILSFALSSAISTKYSPFDDADHLIEYEQSHVQPSGIVYIHPSIYLWLQAVVSAIEL
jgi:hypothetical protein